eukprot:4991477-Amphidinium_carterae.1
MATRRPQGVHMSYQLLEEAILSRLPGQLRTRSGIGCPAQPSCPRHPPLKKQLNTAITTVEYLRDSVSQFRVNKCSH